MRRKFVRFAKTRVYSLNIQKLPLPKPGWSLKRPTTRQTIHQLPNRYLCFCIPPRVYFPHFVSNKNGEFAGDLEGH